MAETPSLEIKELSLSRERYRVEFLSTQRRLEQIASLLHLVNRAKRFYADLERDPKARRLVKEKDTEGLLKHIKDGHPAFLGLVQTFPQEEEKENKLEEGVAKIAFDYVSGIQSLAPDKKIFRKKAQTETANLLVEQSKSFSLLRNPEGKALEIETIIDCHNELLTKTAVLELDPQIEAFALRRWIVRQERRGEKVYLTPYYGTILRHSQGLEEKENGIGGRIYYGPPGTGKTELGIRANEETGFKTHVINLHQYTAFMHLIGQEKIPVGIDREASLMQRLTAARSQIEKWSPAQFWLAARRIAERQGAEPLEILGRFLPEVPADQEIDSEAMKKMRDEYLAYLDTQILAASMGEKTDLTEEETWVNGEILNAIERQEKPYFTEIDKAGPHSLDGILHFLTRSPGEEISFGTKTICIPSWLLVDGDCNLLQLGGEKAVLYNRFNEIYIGYPPAKDEMMITSVWLSDGEGNIVLKPYEQWQMVVFFLYVLPEIRSLYEHLGEGVIEQPFSLRNTKELCGLLVNPKTHERKEMSVGRAIEASLFELRTFTQKEEGREALRRILRKYQQLLAEPVEEVGKPMVSSHHQVSREETRLAALARTVESPLMRTITMLPDQTAEIVREVNFVKEELSPEDLELVEKSLSSKEEVEREPREAINLPNGIQAALVRGQGDVFLTLNVPSEEEGYVEELQRDRIGKEELELKLRDLSSEGRVTLMEISQDDKRKILAHALTGEFVDPAGKRVKGLSFPPEYIDPKNQIELSPNGEWIVQFNSHRGDLNLVSLPRKSGERLELNFGIKIKNYEFTPDSRILMLETLEGETWLVDMEVAKRRKTVTIRLPKAKISGRGWRVVSEKLIVNPSTSEAILIKKD